MPPEKGDGADNLKVGDLTSLVGDGHGNVDNRRLKFVLNYSKDGIPSFACSSKPYRVLQHGIPRDLPWISSLMSLDTIQSFYPHWKEHQREAFWWSEARRLAGLERTCWCRVQEAMAKFQCLVEVNGKQDAGWLQVDREPPVHNA